MAAKPPEEGANQKARILPLELARAEVSPDQHWQRASQVGGLKACVEPAGIRQPERSVKVPSSGRAQLASL